MDTTTLIAFAVPTALALLTLLVRRARHRHDHQAARRQACMRAHPAGRALDDTTSPAAGADTTRGQERPGRTACRHFHITRPHDHKPGEPAPPPGGVSPSPPVRPLTELLPAPIAITHALRLTRGQRQARRTQRGY